MSPEPQPPSDRPPSVCVVVAFWPCAQRMPEDARTVQMFVPAHVDPDLGYTGVAPGWYEPEAKQWFSIEGDPLPDGSVTWWAEQTPNPLMPAQPVGTRSDVQFVTSVHIDSSVDPDDVKRAIAHLAQSGGPLWTK